MLLRDWGMKSGFKRLGNFIRIVDNRNINGDITLLRGVSTTKQLINSVANMSGVSITNYKIVNKNQFVYVSDTSRRGDKIALAFNNSDACIVSSIYTVFEVTNTDKLLPEYLFIWFNRSEFDRYARFNSWGSARETFDWEEMCNIMLPIPPVEVQKKYVALYKAILNNQKSYEESLDDLQLICDGYLENLIKTETYKTLGDYIQQVDERNNDLSINNLLGISVNKIFILTKSNKEKLNLSNYKIVRPRQFGYVTVTSRNGEKISIAILDGEPGLVSSTYLVFEVINENKLLPEYLFLWFKRPDFDRYARFNSWGSARETFDWEEMCRVKLPIPDIEVQKAIITIYHTLETRKRINEKLKNMIKPLCSVLMKGVVERMEKDNHQITTE